MSGRKNKQKQRGQPRKQPSELLNELNSLHDLLNSDDLDEIPLLNQLASPNSQRTPEPSQVEIPTLSAEPVVMSSPAITEAQQQPARTKEEDEEVPTDAADLPILFSPVEELAPTESEIQLAESDLALLRPLQKLPATESGSRLAEPEATMDGTPKASEDTPLETSAPAADNPFLPAHIRARLTGGKVPAGESLDNPKTEPVDTTSATTRTQALVMAQAMSEREGPADKLEPSEKERQRQALVEQLVAQQLPELERQLRAQIEKVVDELGVWD